MDRRSFIRKAGALSAGVTATALAAPAIAQENPKISWRMTSSFTKGLDILFGAGQIVADHVKEAVAYVVTDPLIAQDVEGDPHRQSGDHPDRDFCGQ